MDDDQGRGKGGVGGRGGGGEGEGGGREEEGGGKRRVERRRRVEHAYTQSGSLKVTYRNTVYSVCMPSEKQDWDDGITCNQR